MPVVGVPVMLLGGSATLPAWVDVSVRSRTERGITRELTLLVPRLKHKLVNSDGEPRWVFALWRDRDGVDLRDIPDELIDAGERLSLIPMVGC